MLNVPTCFSKAWHIGQKFFLAWAPESNFAFENIPTPVQHEQGNMIESCN